MTMTEKLFKLQMVSDFKEDQPLFFTYILPADVFPDVHKIPGIEIHSRDQPPRGCKAKQQTAAKRIKWRIMKMPYFWSSSITDAFAKPKFSPDAATM